jgi:hypothetical protein
MSEPEHDNWHHVFTVTEIWPSKGGQHPNWALMSLTIDGEEQCEVQIPLIGDEFADAKIGDTFVLRRSNE